MKIILLAMQLRAIFGRDGPIPIGAITSDNWKYRYWYIISCSKLSNSTTHDHICHFASRADGNAVNHKL